jgi:hypothetical protein
MLFSTRVRVIFLGSIGGKRSKKEGGREGRVEDERVAQWVRILVVKMGSPIGYVKVIMI